MPVPSQPYGFPSVIASTGTAPLCDVPAFLTGDDGVLSVVWFGIVVKVLTGEEGFFGAESFDIGV